jgi:hypothetical protein
VGATHRFLLNAYSQTVSEVVDKVGPSVALVRALGEGRKDAEGKGLGALRPSNLNAPPRGQT